MCTKKELEQNWNRTMIEATRLFFPYGFYPQKSFFFSCPWHFSCIIFKNGRGPIPPEVLRFLRQRLRLNDGGSHSAPAFYFFWKNVELHVDERERGKKSQVQFVEEKSISWSAGLQSVSLFAWCPRGRQQNPGSRWRISVRVRLILDALCSRVSSRGSEEGRRGGEGDME